MHHPPLAPGWIDQPHQRLDLGNMSLESGETLQGAFVTYVVHGNTSRMHNAAILVTTAIGSTHHRLDFLIGAGKALDTDKYAIIVVDAIGNGLSISPSNSWAQSGARFPRFTIRDMVTSQYMLLDYLGIGRLKAVVGASMGGMQALQWGVTHPQRMATLVAMTPMARTTSWSQLMNEISRRALFMDQACLLPRQRADAIRLWTPLTQLLMTRTPTALARFETQAQLQQCIDAQAMTLQQDGPDPFDWCYQSWAYDAHDVGTTPPFAGNTEAALRSIEASTLVLAPTLDLYNPPQAAYAVIGSTPNARFVELPGEWGHASANDIDPVATNVISNAIHDLFCSTPGSCR